MLNKLYEYIHTLIRCNTITTCLKKVLFPLLGPKLPWSITAWTPLGTWRCAVLPGTKMLTSNINMYQRFPITQPVPASFIPCSAGHVSIADGHMFIVSIAITPYNNAKKCKLLFISTTLLRTRSPRASLVLSWIIFDEDHKHSTSAVVGEMQLLLLTYQF